MRYISEYSATKRYNEWLDEIYGEVTVAGYKYSTARTLERIDPVAWREGFNNWLDSEGLTTDANEASDDEEEV